MSPRKRRKIISYLPGDSVQLDSLEGQEAAASCRREPEPEDSIAQSVLSDWDRLGLETCLEGSKRGGSSKAGSQHLSRGATAL